MFNTNLEGNQELTALNNSWKRSKLALVITAAILFNGIILHKVQARKVDLDTLCQKFPLNSRCQGYKSSDRTEAAAASQEPQIIKLRLKTSGPDNEWIRIEKNGNTVKLLHTTKSKTGLSRILNTATGAAPIPIPRIFNFYKWDDHQTTRVAFEPDSCLQLPNNSTLQSSQTSGSLSCTITGTDNLPLVEGMDISKGRFTIEYKEGDLLRSITFRIPLEKLEGYTAKDRKNGVAQRQLR